MRVLLDQECAAVAGGHESQCEKGVTSAAIVIGAGVGAIVGSGAGGVGAIPGAIAGGSAGALVAEVVGPILCASEDEESEEGSDEDSDAPTGNPFRPPPRQDCGPGGNVRVDFGAPLQLVVDTAGHDH